MRPPTRDHQVKFTGRRAGKVSLARITVETSPELSLAQCSCGWEKIHERKKIVEDRAEAHVKKRHHNRAIWM